MNNFNYYYRMIWISMKNIGNIGYTFMYLKLVYLKTKTNLENNIYIHIYIHIYT